MSETINSKDVQVVPRNATNTDIIMTGTHVTMAGTGTGAAITVPGGENGEEIPDAPYRYATPEQSQENKAINDEGIFSPGCPILVEAEKDAERSINGEGKLCPDYQTHIEAEKEVEKSLNDEGGLAPGSQNQAEAENEPENGYPKEAKGEQVENYEANEKEETEKKPDDNNVSTQPLVMNNSSSYQFIKRTRDVLCRDRGRSRCRNYLRSAQIASGQKCVVLIANPSAMK